MANVIEIVLQTKDEMTRGLEAASGSLSRFVSGLGGATGLIGISVAAGTALIGLTKHVSDQVEQLQNLSAATGVSARNLQILEFAFKQGGIDSASLAMGLNFMTRAIANNSDDLKKLGITSRDSFTAFQQTARVLTGMQDVAARNALAFQIFGRGAAQLIPILEQVANSYGKLSDAAERSGNVFSPAQLAQMSAVDKKFDEISASVGGLAKQLVVLAATHIPDWIRLLIDPLHYVPMPHGKTFKTGGPNSPAVEGIDVVADRIKGIDQRSFAQGFEGDRLGLRGSTDLSYYVSRQIDVTDTKMTEFGKHMLAVAEQVRASFAIIGGAVFSGLTSVFVNLTNRAQTFRSAIVTVFQSMVQGVLQAIGELIAAQVTKMFLKLLGFGLSFFTGNPAFGIAVDSGGIASISPGSIPGVGTASARGGNTFVIQTISAKDVLSQLVSPTGSLRGANDRIFEVAAVS